MKLKEVNEILTNLLNIFKFTTQFLKSNKFYVYLAHMKSLALFSFIVGSEIRNKIQPDPG
jgi:hypothetical protein